MIRTFRILVIDDDPGIRDTYREILSDTKSDELLDKGAALFEAKTHRQIQSDQHHYDVILEERGDKGIEIIETSLKEDQPISLIFIDMSIPGKNGAETARLIWEIDEDIKIVFVTAFSEYTPDEITDIVGREDIFYLRKPFNPDEIRQFARALTKEWFLEREKRSLTKDLQRANRELEELNNSLNERVEKQTALLIQSEKMASLGILTSGIAHKLNTPVSTIKENLSKLDQSSGLIKQFVNRSDARRENGSARNNFLSAVGNLDGLIRNSAEEIIKIEKTITNLKAISKSDDTTYRQTDIHEIIDTTLNVIHNDIKQELRIEKEYSDLPEIWCYPQKLSQAILNILVNSVQAAPPDGVISIKTELDIRGKRASDQLIRLTFRDNGSGIAEQDILKLFDPFFTTKPIGEGTGLGLSITYDIVKLHHGDITINSKPGEGTTVTITIPSIP